MNSNKAKRKLKTNKISIRVTMEVKKFLKENKYSPTSIFYEAIRELGFQE